MRFAHIFPSFVTESMGQQNEEQLGIHKLLEKESCLHSIWVALNQAVASLVAHPTRTESDCFWDVLSDHVVYGLLKL